MLVFVGGKITDFADPLPARDRVIIEVEVSVAPASAPRVWSFGRLREAVRRRTRLAGETLLLDGPAVLARKALHLVRREAQTFGHQVHCFVGRPRDSAPMGSVAGRVAGFSLTHPKHTERALARRSDVRSIGDEVCPELATLSLYGAVLIQAVEAALRKDRPIAVSGEGLAADLAHEMLVHCGAARVGRLRPHAEVSIFGRRLKTAEWGSEMVLLTTGASPAHREIGGHVVSCQWSGRSDPRGWPRAAESEVFDVYDLIGDDSRIVDLHYYDGEPEYPRWFDPGAFDRYLQFLRDSNLTLGAIANRQELTRGVEVRTVAPMRFVYFPARERAPRYVVSVRTPAREANPRNHTIGLIGGGRWPIGMILRTMEQYPNTTLRRVCDRRPEVAWLATRAMRFEEMTTDPEAVYAAADVDTVVVAPYHGVHAPLAARALAHGKNVFLEKPPVISREQLDHLSAAARSSAGRFYVGYNRRFAPLNDVLLPELMSESGPATLHFYMRSIDIPSNNWYYWPSNGNRIISNVCHLIDYALFLLPFATPAEIHVRSARRGRTDENVIINLFFDEGSMANIVYSDRGSVASGYFQRYVIARGRLIAEIDDFSSLRIRRASRIVRRWKGIRDMGHRRQVRTFMDAVTSGGPPPVPLRETLASAHVLMAAADASVTGAPVPISLPLPLPPSF